MAKSKDTTNHQPAADQELEAKVDAMMDPSLPDAAATEPAGPAKAGGELPPLDIFSDPQTAPAVPDDLLTELKSQPDPAASEEPPVQTEPPAVELDDPATDAAVDAIEAQEADTLLETEDAEQQAAAEQMPETAPAARKKVHHHPVFWTIVFVLAILAILAGYLLASGGNSQLPGTGTVRHWVDKLQS